MLQRFLPSILLVVTATVTVGPWPTLVDASNVACTETAQCEAILRNGSQCVNGFCSNSFYHGGCLKSVLPNWNKTRVCNSEDPPEAEALGYCRQSPMDYQEIRIAGMNWESANFVTWVMQILLSEVLDVPTSVDPGRPDLNMNFYDPASGFDFGSVIMDYRFGGHAVADRVKDCRLVKTNNPDAYEACYHVVSEMWWSTFLEEGKIEGIESTRELGAMGENAWYIPFFAADKDPTLTSYMGFMGEKNRRKVAETFKRPTRWKQYCEEVSNCSKPDGFAMRAPVNEEEEQSFFVDGLYTGYFRMTDEGDCDKFPDNCTGAFINYACGWNSYAPQQTYHLDIPFSYEGPELNGGYSAVDATQIWKAANATKSPVAMVWWSPQPLYETFLGTDAEFTRVNFPPPTPECVDARMNLEDLCVENATRQASRGDPEGVCDFYPQLLQKTFSFSLKEITEDESLAEAFWSPARDLLINLKIDNLQLSEIFKLWRDRGTDMWGFDPRDASCQWVAENFDRLQAFVPETHPRVFNEVNSQGETLFKGALGFSIFAICAVSFCLAFCILKKKSMAVYHMQCGFLGLVLFGMLLVSSGALILTTTPSDASCAVTPWLINLGYVFHFVPFVVRISAISRLATDGKRMQRVRLRHLELCAYVSAAALLVIAFLLVWTLVDSPEKTHEYEMTNRITSEGNHVIESLDYCGAEYDNYWLNASFVWRGLVLLSGCMIGFLAMRVREDMNDTKSIFWTLVVHFVILVLQIIACSALFESSRSDWMGYASILHSFDTIASMGLYVLPKFFDRDENKAKAEMLPDLFVHTTIALLDVVGFSAWTSVREPVAVFQFLEQLYENFDRLAGRHSVCQVETVGECYVAATGVPKPQSDHAVLMAMFALDCMEKFPKYVKRMETQFGPDTGDLCLQIAMHSGPVTGGVLTSKAARFQLFGASVTTANQLLATSVSGRIHLSDATANLLIKSGKQQWVVQREEKVHTSHTFWLNGGRRNSLKGVEAGRPDEEEFVEMESEQRWIEWNVKVFENLLTQIVARRTSVLSIPTGTSTNGNISSPPDITKAEMPLEEVKEIIELPKFDKRAARRQRDNQDVVIPDFVIDELREFVSEVAALYNDYPFHNFAHASYVVMAVTKYMNRIIAATEVELRDNEERARSSVQSALHDHTYGITSDPLTQFACVFSALIHDVAHPGVPNTRWIQENDEVSARYRNRSVAEQNSLDLSWELLMQHRFDRLRSTICSDAEELRRFRQLVVNCVMATDLGDKELKALRNGRWEKAFSPDFTTRAASVISTASEDSTDEIEVSGQRRNDIVSNRKQLAINRKATIVIEHLIQAADIAHTCQHWHIYRKWNERLFRELYQAYREGRAEANPADNWYEGEIGFFDFYIIPLSEKIRDCGVFGPTSDENLNYAFNNRSMWVNEGEQIVKDMLEQAEMEYTGQECARDPTVRLTPLPGIAQLEIEI